MDWLASARRVPHERDGSRLLFRRSDLDSWVAVATLAFAGFARSLPLAITLRTITGLAFAGVYPVGMKLMTSWFR